MVASSNTMVRVAEVLIKHLPPDKLRLLISDMLDVPGDKSFRETVTGVAKAVDAILSRPKLVRRK